MNARQFTERTEESRRWEIAIEHAYWCSMQGFTPSEVILSVDQALPVNPTWSDVAYALVYAQIALERSRRLKRMA